jgi:hypothetical protein
MSVHIDMSEVDRLAVELGMAGPKLASAAGAIVSDEAEDVRDRAAAASPVLTGELAAGWYVTNAGPTTKIVTNRTRQAFYQEFGTSVMSPQPSLFPASNHSADTLGRALLVAADPLL